MKAWIANTGRDSFYSTIVFANTAGEAKARAIETETFEDEIFCNIRVRRFREADCLFKGANEIDWYDPDMRIKLVRDFGWIREAEE